MLFCALPRTGAEQRAFFVPLVLFSIPAAIGIHTVTAFLYNGLAAPPVLERLDPRAALPRLGLLLRARRSCSSSSRSCASSPRFEIKDEAIWKIAELMAYAMFLNLFLLGAEVFKEYYSDTEHLVHMQYLFTGSTGTTRSCPCMWLVVACNVIAFVLFLVPRRGENPVTLNIGCVLIFIGVYIEKGMGLVIPGLTPDTLGEIYEYVPTGTELLLTLGIWATGLLVFTLLLRVAVPILTGDFLIGDDGRTAVIVDTEFIRRADHLAEQSYRD